MYIVIVGCGNVGSHLTRTLLAIGHEVLVIEKDPQRCKSIRDELGDLMLQGDGTHVQVLKEAGTSRADVVIAVTSRDEDNLATCQISKHLFRVPKTIALVIDPSNEALFKLLGVDTAINSTHLILTTIEEEIPGHALVHLMDFRIRERDRANEGSPPALSMNPHLLVSINVPSDSAVARRSLGDIDLPPNSFVSLVVKAQGPVLPSDDLIIDPGDDVLVVTSSEEEQLLYETLTGVE
jgi:trk system potassium uptake protein TrkA